MSVGRGVLVGLSSISGCRFVVALARGVFVDGSGVDGTEVAIDVSVSVAEGKTTSTTAVGTRVGVGSRASLT